MNTRLVVRGSNTTERMYLVVVFAGAATSLLLSVDNLRMIVVDWPLAVRRNGLNKPGPTILVSAASNAIVLKLPGAF